MTETDLYDGSGHAVAYIANDGETIYTWSGHAVAYVVDDEKVYGWNGKHIGWWRDGIVYDGHGRAVGYLWDRCPVATFATPAKYAKFAKFAKHARYAAHARPVLTAGQSNLSLEAFLKQGAVG